MPTGQELPCVRLTRLPHRNGMFLNSWKIFSRGRQNIMSGKWINLPNRLKPSRPNWLKRGAAVKKKSDVRKKRRKMRMPPLYVKCSPASNHRSEEYTSELQSRGHLVCRLLLEKKKQNKSGTNNIANRE